MSCYEQPDFDAATTMAGYRMRISSIPLPKSLSAGSSFSASSQWANDGVAPDYRDWNVVLQLRDSLNGSVGWRGISTLSLRTLLPTGSSSVSIVDNFSLSADTPKGGYNLELVVQDQNGYFPPLT